MSVIECGTPSGARRHFASQEKPCAACKKAWGERPRFTRARQPIEQSAPCGKCGTTGPLKARGLCKKCYGEAQRSSTLDKYELTHPRAEQKTKRRTPKDSRAHIEQAFAFHGTNFQRIAEITGASWDKVLQTWDQMDAAYHEQDAA